MPAVTAASLTVRIDPAVALAVGEIGGGDARPGQRTQLPVQAGLVAFDGEQVAARRGRSGRWRAGAGCTRVGGDDRVGDLDSVQQRGERGDLVGLAVHCGLSEDHPGALVEGREQMRGGAVRRGRRGRFCRPRRSPGPPESGPRRPTAPAARPTLPDPGHRRRRPAGPGGGSIRSVPAGPPPAGCARPGGSQRPLGDRGERGRRPAPRRPRSPAPRPTGDAPRGGLADRPPRPTQPTDRPEPHRHRPVSARRAARTEIGEDKQADTASLQ